MAKRIKPPPTTILPQTFNNPKPARAVKAPEIVYPVSQEEAALPLSIEAPPPLTPYVYVPVDPDPVEAPPEPEPFVPPPTLPLVITPVPDQPPFPISPPPPLVSQ